MRYDDMNGLLGRWAAIRRTALTGCRRPAVDQEPVPVVGFAVEQNEVGSVDEHAVDVDAAALRARVGGVAPAQVRGTGRHSGGDVPPPPSAVSGQRAPGGPPAVGR